MGIVRHYRNFGINEGAKPRGWYCPRCGGVRLWIADRPYGGGNDTVCLDCGHHCKSSELVDSPEKSEGAERLDWSKEMDAIERRVKR